MTLPSSGKLSLSDIRTELILLGQASLRSYSNIAGKTIPDSISEFYGYTARSITVIADSNPAQFDNSKTPCTVPNYDVTANAAWYISCPSWIVATPSGASGSDTVVVSIGTGTPPKTGTIDFYWTLGDVYTGYSFSVEFMNGLCI